MVGCVSLPGTSRCVVGAGVVRTRPGAPWGLLRFRFMRKVVGSAPCLADVRKTGGDRRAVRNLLDEYVTTAFPGFSGQTEAQRRD